jgi:hypothetical protein
LTVDTLRAENKRRGGLLNRQPTDFPTNSIKETDFGGVDDACRYPRDNHEID